MPISKPALAIMLGALVPVAVPAKAQEQAPKPIYYRLASGAPALLYEPATLGPKSAIGILVMHASADYLTHSSCTELSKRGYRVMCANNSTSKSGVSDDGVLDKVLTEFKEGVVALRGVPGIKKVVLFGHSGGATITSDDRRKWGQILSGAGKDSQMPRQSGRTTASGRDHLC
jgi:hypothetical protein